MEEGMPQHDWSNLSLFDKCPEKNIDALLHQVIDAVIRPSTPDYSKFSEVWTLEEWFSIISALKKVIIFLSKGNYDKSSADEMLNALSDLHRERLMHCLKVRKDDIRNGLVKQTSTISESYLEDFDFKAKYALASDKISSVQEPLVNLSLTVNEDGNEKTVPLEMNINELKSFIASLEAANKAVLQLSL